MNSIYTISEIDDITAKTNRINQLFTDNGYITEVESPMPFHPVVGITQSIIVTNPKNGKRADFCIGKSDRSDAFCLELIKKSID